MNLQKISEVKDKMELMYNSIYDLQEAIQEENEAKKHEIAVMFKSTARDLYLTLISASITTKESMKVYMTDTSLIVLETEIEKASGLKVSELKSTTRKREFVVARQLHMSLLNVTYQLSTTESGSYYGKDHATVIHSKNTIRNLYQTDKLFVEQYSSVIDHCIRFDLSRGSTKTHDFLNEK